MAFPPGPHFSAPEVAAWTVRPQSKCGLCYCKQASRTVSSVYSGRILGKCYIFMWHVITFSFYSKPLSLTSNNQTHNTLLLQYLHPSVHPDMVCLCLWCCDSSAPAAFSLHSFHPRSPRGRPHLSQSLPQSEGIRQMQDLADGRQVHGQITFMSCMLYRFPACNDKIN